MSVDDWWLKPITRADVEDAVDRYLPRSLHDDETRQAFIEHNARQWEGALWRDAQPWNLATEWARFMQEGRG